MNFLFSILGQLNLEVESSQATGGTLKQLWQSAYPPEDISVSGHLITDLFNYTTYMNLLFFSLVCFGIFGFSYLYRKSRHPKAYYTHGTKKKHVLTVVGIASLVFILIDMKITTQSNEDFLNVFAKWPTEEEKPIKIQVLGQQWAWNFRYAGNDGLFNTDDDVVLLNDLRVPIGRKIIFQITSKDVIHSLYLPNAKQKVDAIPGRLTRMWVELTKAGLWDIACAEMCGTYHYRMQAKLTTYTQEDYDAWLKEANEKAAQENDLTNPDLFWGWKWEN